VLLERCASVGEAEETQGGVALFEEADADEAAGRLGESEFVMVLEDDEPVGREKCSAVGGEEVERATVIIVSSVRRIGEDEVQGRSRRRVAGGEFFEGGEGVGSENGRAARDSKRVEIAADEFRGRRVMFDEDGFDGAAAKRFDAHGASARENVEETRAFHCAAQNVEQRLAQPVTCRTQCVTFEAFQYPAAIFTGDDAHGRDFDFLSLGDK